jgi:hypothetical protein
MREILLTVVPNRLAASDIVTHSSGTLSFMVLLLSPQTKLALS